MSEALASGNVAVITGAASGIGRAVANRLGGLGMRVVLVDRSADKLPAAEAEIRAAAAGDNNAGVMSFHLDVSDSAAMTEMAEQVTRDWQSPSLLMNNAAIGVHGGSGDTSAPVANWRGVFDVNFFGVLNGVAAFMPHMLEAGRAGIIVNTGSKQGITHPPGNPAYNVVKAALNAYTMNLARDLRETGDGKLSAHLLVPGWTTTGDSAHRPGAWLPDQVAGYLLDHLEAGDFYIICPDDETSSEVDRKRFAWQAGDMLENRPALSRWHPDFADAFARHMKA